MLNLNNNQEASTAARRPESEASAKFRNLHKPGYRGTPRMPGILALLVECKFCCNVTIYCPVPLSFSSIGLKPAP